MFIELAAARFSGPLAERLARSSGDPGVALYWLGQAGFVISGAGRRIVIDPYLSDSLAEKYRGKRFPHERMMPPPIEPAELRPLDLVLCTHRHTDHMDPDTLAPLARDDPALRFVVPVASLGEARKRIGVEDERLLPLDAGETIEPLPGIRISAVRAAHEALERDEKGRHVFLGYVIRVGGFVIFHSGDTVPFAGMEDEMAVHRPDLALLPVNGRSEELRAAGIPGNLTLDEALALCAACGIPAMIAHHYGMFAFNTLAPEIIDERVRRPPTGVKLLRAETATEYLLSRR